MDPRVQSVAANDALLSKLAIQCLYTAAVLIAIGWLLSLKNRLTNKTLRDFYASQPCPSVKQQHFPWVRAVLRSVSDTPARVAEGYDKYSKANLPFLVPNIRKGPVLALPPTQLKAVFRNGEDKLSTHGPQADGVSAKYTIRDPAIYPSNYTVDIFRKHITKKYSTVADTLAEELFLALDEVWGKSTEWHAVNVSDTLRRVAVRGVNRITVGLPMCRNEAYLKRTTRYSVAVVVGGFLIAFLPKWLKPILGPLIALPGTNDCEAGIEILLPLVTERLAEYKAFKSHALAHDYSPPNDVLQWIIEESDFVGDPAELQPRRIAHRIIMMNFNAVPPIALTLAHLLLDVHSGPQAPYCVEKIMEELQDVMGSPSSTQKWSKENVGKFVLMDSALRESMRKSHFGTHAFPRQVSAPDGIVLDGGIKVPQGVQIEVPVHNIHMDERYYQDATTYKPFRFADKSGPTRNNGQEQRWAVTIDETFLGFGFGRSGCPGRFFAVHVLKTLMGRIMQNYDIEMMDVRPPLTTVMEIRFQSESQMMKIRRKPTQA